MVPMLPSAGLAGLVLWSRTALAEPPVAPMMICMHGGIRHVIIKARGEAQKAIIKVNL